MQKKIAIVYGGYSSEEEISLKSGKVVFNNLPKNFTPYLVRINNDGWFLERNGVNIPINKSDFSVDVDGQKLIFDRVFIAIHGTPGEDGKLQAYFDMVGMPYASSNALACAITFNKWTCNTILKQHGFNCAESVVLRNKDHYKVDDIMRKISFPCFVKPNNGGSSFGISKVKESSELVPAIEKAFLEGSEVIIENFLKGTEVTCGVIHIHNSFIDLPLTEIVSQNEFFDYEAKYKGESQEITPARISEELTTEIKATAQKAFKLLNLKGMARIDFMIEENTPYIIEVNTVPGLSEESLIPQMIRGAGKTLTEVFGGLIE